MSKMYLASLIGFSLFVSASVYGAEQEEASAAAGDSAMSEEAAPADVQAQAAEAPSVQPAMLSEVKLPGDPAKGKQVYDSICFACHGQGVAGAPKIGDKSAWGPRIAQGMDVLVSHSISGFTGKTGTMPPKGGRMDLSDADMANCVSYMVSQAQ